MSNFLDVIRARIDGCYIKGLESCLPVHSVDDHNLKIDKIIDKLDSLGENARRMLEIGIAQDKLVKLGLKFSISTRLVMNKIKADKIMFSVYLDAVYCIQVVDYLGIIIFDVDYTTPTWQDDLINRVKELINETN